MKTFSILAKQLLAAALGLLPLMGQAQNISVSGSQSIAGGMYNNITITSTGTLGLMGPLTVNGTLRVQSGGRLSPNCNIIAGAGNYVQEANGTLDICNPAGISLSGPTGAVQLMGTRSYSSDGNYNYSGVSPGQITGTGLPATVRSLQNFNSDGDPATVDLILSSDVNVRQLLKSTGGTLSVVGHQVRLLSVMNSTALIANSGGGLVVGPVTVERFIRPDMNAGAGYRHYAAPVSGQTVANLATAGFAPVFNPAYNVAVLPRAIQPFPTVFDYDQSLVDTKSAITLLTPFEQGFRASSSTDPMSPGKGFTVHLAAGALVAFTGLPNNGPYSVTGLNRGTTPDGGWQFMGNPYPSPLNWAVLCAQAGALVNVGDALYVFETTGTYVGNYRSYINVIGNPSIASGQGFYVRSTADNGAVNFDNVARTDVFDPADGVFRRGTGEARPLVRLTLANAANTIADDAVVYAQAGATATFGAHFDAPKLANSTGLNLAVQCGAAQYSIKGLPDFGTAAPRVVPLVVALPAAGAYSLRVAELLNLPAGLTATLHDAVRGTRTALTPTTTYAFTSSTTAANGRFSLELVPAGTALATGAAQLDALVQLYPNPASNSFHLTLPTSAAGRFHLTNALGQKVLSRSFATSEVDVDVRSLRAGIYQVHLTLAGTPVVRRVVVQ